VTPLVLLHGWGTRPTVFDDVRSRLHPRRDVFALALPGYEARDACSPYTLEAIVEALAVDVPPKCVIAGWSLGGHVAMHWALSRPAQVQALALIAATPTFVQRPGWPDAVAREVLQSFADSLDAHRDATLKRFASLQAQGDMDMKAVALALRAALAAEADASTANLQHGLRILLDTDMRTALSEIAQPTLVIHGNADHLVPHAAGEHLAASLPRAELRTIVGSAHAHFLSRPADIARLLEELAA
jgi:pimeloyl-[acyl-carrier protein] methyl ester esterase